MSFELLKKKEAWKLDEEEALKRAQEKYQTKEDALKGTGWVQKGPGATQMEHHKTPTAQEPKEKDIGKRAA